MPTSTVTSKFQTTIPKEVRRGLKIARNAILDWKVEGGRAVVRPADLPIMRFKGSFRVGPGDIRKDIETARAARARDAR